MNDSPRHIVVTGGTGYIGHRLVERAMARGLFVTMLGRSPVAGQAGRCTRWRKWSLTDAVPDDALDGGDGFPAVDTVIHLAHQWESTAPEAEDENLIGLDRLLVASRRRGLRRFVFGSSVSARQDARNRYGRTKWRNEQKLKAPAEIAARVGLVYGGPEQGQWGTLCRLVRASPLLPMIGASRPVQPIHLDDACEGLLGLAAAGNPSRAVYGIAAAKPVAFGTLLRMIAEQTFGRRLLVVPLPAVAALAILPFVPANVGERIRGLLGITTHNCRDELAEIGISLRALRTGLAECAVDRRRRLLLEGRVVLHYLLGQPPSLPSLRAYARGVVRHGDGCPLMLPWAVHGFPGLLRAVEPLAIADTRGRPEGVRQRLDMAMRLAEALPAGAALLYDTRGSGALAAMAGIIAILAAEAMLVPLRLILSSRHR